MKSVSSLLVMAFLNSYVLCAQEGNPIWADGAVTSWTRGHSDVFPHSGKLKKGDVSGLSLPWGIAGVEGYCEVGLSRTIINVQDAHASMGAQKSIVAILDSLVSDYDLSLIAVEGSSGYVDTSILRSFPHENIRKETAEHFMQKSRISAGEFFAVTSDRPIALYGVEDRSLYKENVEQFGNVYVASRYAIPETERLLSFFRSVKIKIYPSRLLELEDNAILGGGSQKGFLERWNAIREITGDRGIDRSEYPNLGKLTDAVSYEQVVDFQKANLERDQLIDALMDVLSYEELERLVTKSLAFKTGHMSQTEFYVYIQNMALKGGLSPEPYSDLIRYTEYVAIYESIDMAAIFEEVRKFENSVRDMIFTDEEQRSVHSVSRYAELLKKLFELRLTPVEFGELSKKLEGIGSGDIKEFIEKYSGSPGVGTHDIDLATIFAAVPYALDFYRVVEERNDAMFSNTIRRMDERGQQVAALITGGFHTDGLVDIIRSNKTSYFVIFPKFDESAGERPYVAVLTNRRDPYERLLEKGKHIIEPELYLSEGIRDLQNVEAFIRDIVVTNIGQAVLNGEDITETKQLWVEGYRNAYEKLIEQKSERPEGKSSFSIQGPIRDRQTEYTAGTVMGDTTLATTSFLPQDFSIDPASFEMFINDVHAVRVGNIAVVRLDDRVFVTVQRDPVTGQISARPSSAEEVRNYARHTDPLSAPLSDDALSVRTMIDVDAGIMASKIRGIAREGSHEAVELLARFREGRVITPEDLMDKLAATGINVRPYISEQVVIEALTALTARLNELSALSQEETPEPEQEAAEIEDVSAVEDVPEVRDEAPEERIDRVYDPKIQVFRDKGRLGENVGEDIANVINDAVADRGKALVMFPTGSTPKPVYEELIQQAHAGEFDFTNVTIFMMDEYKDGIDYATFIVENLITRLPDNNRPENVYVLRGHNEDFPYVDQYVKRVAPETYEKLIKEGGGLDLVLGGIGVEGHMAFNEAGSGRDTRTRLVKLEPSTKVANAEAREKGYTHAYTAGIGTILEARKIFQIVTGAKKAWVVDKLLRSDPGPDIPSTWLKLHDDYTIYLDKECERAMRLMRSGRIITFAMPNIRTGDDGYAWGMKATASRIFKMIYHNHPWGWESFRDYSGKKPKLYTPISEYWIASDDDKYPTKVDLGGYLPNLLRDFFISKGYYFIRLKLKDIPVFGSVTGQLKKIRSFEKMMSRIRDIRVFPFFEEYLNSKKIYFLMRPSAKLNDLLEGSYREILGERHFKEYGPWLATVMKLIDSHDTLSIGIHPRMDNDLGLPGRPEMWLTIESSRAFFGFKEDMNFDKIKKAIPAPDKPFDKMKEEELQGYILEKLDNFLSRPGHLGEHLNVEVYRDGELVDVPGAVIHAIMAGSFLAEWSYAPAKDQLQKPIRADLAQASIAAEDRGDKALRKKARVGVMRKDGKTLIFPKERPDRVKDFLDDAVKKGFPAYDKLEPSKYRFEPVSIGEFDSGKIKVDTLFQTKEIVVERITAEKGSSSLRLQEFTGRGYPVFVQSGTAVFYSREGNKIGELRQGYGGIIPAYLAEEVYVVAKGSEELVLHRWFAPFSDERELIAASRKPREADLSIARVYSEGPRVRSGIARILRGLFDESSSPRIDTAEQLKVRQFTVMADSIDVRQAAAEALHGTGIRIATLKDKAEIGIILDESLTAETILSDRSAFRDSVWLAAISSSTTRSDLIKVLEVLKQELPDMDKVDLDSSLKEALSRALLEGLEERIKLARGLLDERKREIAKTYGEDIEEAIGEVLSLSEKVAVVTTERVAVNDPFSADHMSKARSMDIGNVFIYGDIYRDDESSSGEHKARAFVRACGYSDSNMIFLDKNKFETLDDLITKVAELTGVRPQNVGIRMTEGELPPQKADMLRAGSVLNIPSRNVNGREVYVAMNSYKAILRILAFAMDPDMTHQQLPPGVVATEQKGMFSYLPKVVPIDYASEIEAFKRMIEYILTAA